MATHVFVSIRDPNTYNTDIIESSTHTTEYGYLFFSLPFAKLMTLNFTKYSHL